MHVGLRAGLGFALASTVLAWSARSEAAEPLIVLAGTSSLSGEHSYSHVVIEAGATLQVPSGSAQGSGVTIRATTIVIEEGGAIDASASGFPGADNANGGGPVGGGIAGATTGQPGGGGGHFGLGGVGTASADCTEIGAAGGMAYSMIMEALVGSAGGAAGVTTPMAVGTKGGNGGGTIVLEASRIEISGSILAEGQVGLFKAPFGAGGGAGGGIYIKAFELVVNAGARISVKGGDGGRAGPSAPQETGRGGGGSGGYIIVEAPPPDMSVFDIAGGDGCDPSNAAGDGQPGFVELRTPPADCFDLDGDGVTGCANQDCDDVDDTIKPGAEESCDGIDSDCDETPEIDEEKPNGDPVCGEAQICAASDAGLNPTCLADPDAGTTTTGGSGAPPPGEVRFVGGCGFAAAAAGAGGAGACLLAAIGALLRRGAKGQRGKGAKG